MNSKQLINEALHHRQSKETSFIKRCSDASLIEISRESGVSYEQIRNWVKGKNEPNYGNLLAVLNACGCDLKFVKN